MTILDLFAGPGGWEEGLKSIGRTDVIGIEWDADACATARAAGHQRIHEDVRVITPEMFPDCTGLIASPPCPNFSAGGLGKGRNDMPALLKVSAVRSISELQTFIKLSSTTVDEQSALALQPIRFALELAPQWMAWEQVPEVLPLWKACAPALRAAGYSVDCGVLAAAYFGVPQSRRRAFLVANKGKPWAALPVARSARLSMAQALGWDAADLVGFPRRADRGESVVLQGIEYRARDLFRADGPSQTLTEKARSWRRWPAGGGDPVPIETTEAAVLQGFRPDYPWHGSRSSQFHQIGNAVPPPLAAAVLTTMGAARLEPAA